MNNFHTHTYRCKHASGDVIDYADQASQAGMEILGMSDHCPFPDGRWPHVRMDLPMLPDYERAVYRAREKYPDLTIIKGLECEWVPSMRAYIEDTFLADNRFQYLIGAVHWIPYLDEWLELREITPFMLRSYSDLLIEAMETGLYLFIAHPDIFGMGYYQWDEDAKACSKDILEAAEELDIPLEINGYGMRKPNIITPYGEERDKYPWIPFWEMASDYDIRVVCNSDAHKPEDVADSIDRCLDIAHRFELEVEDFSDTLFPPDQAPVQEISRK